MWQATDIPDLTGKTAIVTGGNVGLGFASSVLLAKNGARVVIACRDEAKGHAAVARLDRALPGADATFLQLDLADPASISRFADDASHLLGRLDVLLNNAGVVNLEKLQHSPLGHELHMATNHFGHFAVTGRLFPLLLETAGARVVTVSSGAYRQGEIRLDDLGWNARPYDRMKAYGDSKLANLLFMYGLQERFEGLRASAISVAAHPGLTGTERQQSIGVGGALTRWLASPVESGVRSQLRAATDPSVKGGQFYGPRFGVGGPAVLLNSGFLAARRDLSDELWHRSEEITGVSFGGA